MKMLTFFLVASLFYSNAVKAEFDPFNVYQYQAARSAQKPWFEWWYYKVVLPESGESFFFVYGVVNPWDIGYKMKGTRAYVGMGDFNNKAQVENKFSVDKFMASYDQTLIKVEQNIATEDNIKGQLHDKTGDIYTWDFTVKKDWAFNATGWATGKGITDIEWYPAQAGAHCSGTIVSHNQLHQFSNAPCYQDRNWGYDFPLWWTWIVSNQFKDNPDTILAIGGGRPKYLGTDFPFQGASIGLHHKGIDYHFRPNDFDIVRTNISFGKWEIKAENKTNKIEISAYAPKDKFMDLQFMTPNGEIFHDYETLTGSVTIRLYKRIGLEWKILETLTSDFAGIEYGSPEATNSFSNTKLSW